MKQTTKHPIVIVLTKIIDLKGSIWMGVFSWIMVLGLIRCVLLGGPDLPAGALALYGTVIATFGITKLGAKAINGKNGHTVNEND